MDEPYRFTDLRKILSQKIDSFSVQLRIDFLDPPQYDFSRRVRCGRGITFLDRCRTRSCKLVGVVRRKPKMGARC